MKRAAPTNGFVLLAVLVVSMLAAMLVLSTLYRIRAEHGAESAGEGREQAWHAAMSGLHRAASIVADAPYDPERWLHNAALFERQFVADDGADDWYFTVYAEATDEQESGEVRYGVTDESAKLNLHFVDREVLTKIPALTEPQIAGLLDFLDPGSEPRPGGAEDIYYETLPTPYHSLDGQVTTLDELLLVRGFNAGVLYGEDANRNARLDVGEDDGELTFPMDNGDGELDLGLRQYLTVHTARWAVDREGRPQVNLNRDVDRLAELGFSDETLRYIATARRQSRQAAFSHPVDLLEAEPIESVDENGETVELECGVGEADLEKILDRCTTQSEEREVTPCINVYTASAKVLELVADIDSELAEAIVSHRFSIPVDRRHTTDWLLRDGLLDTEHYKKIAPSLGTRGFQFHLQVIGFGVPSGRFRVLEAVVDVGYPQPRIIYLRDLTRLGVPFALATEEGRSFDQP